MEILGFGSVQVTEGGGKHRNVLIPGLFLTNTEQCDDGMIKRGQGWTESYLLYKMYGIFQLQPLLFRPRSSSSSWSLALVFLGAHILREINIRDGGSPLGNNSVKFSYHVRFLIKY